MNELLQAIN